MSRSAVLVLLLGLLWQRSHGWNHMADRVQRTFANLGMDSRPWVNSTDRGYLMCAGDKHLPDTIRALYELRVMWKSLLPVAVVHCNELSIQGIGMLRLFRNVQLVNACAANHLETMGLSLSVALKRFRGFFCKLAAFVVSPYQQSLFMDADTVWFQSPDQLFDAKAFQQTGALFFRDRTLYSPLYDRFDHPGDMLATILKLHEALNITVDGQYVARQYASHGLNHFWRSVNIGWNSSFLWKPSVGQFQESSVVLIDRPSHKRTIATLSFMISHPEFDSGYGDKEMFWIAATVSGDDFVFEPFLAGQYGDCSGFVLHFHPDDIALYQSASADAVASKVRPLYINAEYLVEYDARLKSVGEFIASSITKPVPVTADMSMPPHNNCYLRDYRSSNCTCGAYECIAPPVTINMFVLRSQWITMSVRRGGNNIPEGMCVPLLNEQLPLLQGVFKGFPRKSFDMRECAMLGCPWFPLMRMKNASEWLPGRGRICDPVRFSDALNSLSVIASRNITALSPQDLEFRNLSMAYRQPRSPMNLPRLNPQYPLMGCRGHGALYLLGQDQIFHVIPNWNTFVKMGFDTDYVTQFEENDCQNAIFGDTLPSL